jgi:hypothetical protein
MLPEIWFPHSSNLYVDTDILNACLDFLQNTGNIIHTSSVKASVQSALLLNKSVS